MRPQTVLAAIILHLAVAFSPAGALAEKRFALVVGNSAYQHVGALRNAANDAGLVAAAFEATGFEVMALTDLDEDGMGRAIEELERRRDSLDVVALYFAGHGLQKDGENYLVPVDAELRSQSAIERETIALKTIIDVLQPVPVSLIFLDACRNNPIADAAQAEASASRNAAVKRGLAVVRTHGDMLVAFATLPNTVASDGESDNSPFARALARHIRTPDTEVSVLMKRVTRDVMAETKDEQRPQQLSQMQTEFYFTRTGKAETVTEGQRSLLAVYPPKVGVGEEVSVVADVPTACRPSFVNIAPGRRITPIPLQFFKTVDLGNGQLRYEISPGSRYGLVVEEGDEKGVNRLGFFCEPQNAADPKVAKALLRDIVARLDAGETSGTVDGGAVEYRFNPFEIR